MIRLFSQYISSKTLILVAIECVIITIALAAGMRLRLWNDVPQSFLGLPAQIAICVIVLQVCMYYTDFYDDRSIRRRYQQIVCLTQSIGAACVILAVIYHVSPGLSIGRGVFLGSILVVGSAVMISRLALDTAWHMAAPTKHVAVIGAGEIASNVAREINARDDLNLKVTGVIACSDEPSQTGVAIGEQTLPSLGTIGDIQHIIANKQISIVIVAVDNLHAKPLEDLVRLRLQGLRVEHAHQTMAALTGRIWLDMVPSSWFVFSTGFRRSKFVLVSKRLLDVMISITGLVICAPVMAAIALAVRLDSKGPAIYRQTRVGYRGKVFEVLKFRSMREDAESASGAQWAQQRDPRVTRVGAVLRKYRLDELPQFINVIRGEMSFIGPRPERPVFVEHLRDVIPFYDERHMVRPGITGWAQVEYEYGSTIEDARRKLEYDLFYLMNMSLIFDCAVVVKTVRILISGRGSR